MKVRILGSGGGYGIPNPFCHCANCEAARAAGGKSLRNAPAVLINDDLLIDCGPDVINSVKQFGLSLAGLRTLLITHRHSDHLDPWFFWARHGVVHTELPLLTVYAPRDVLDHLLDFYERTMGWDQAAFEANTRTACHAVQAGMMKLVGRYRVFFFQATHGNDDLSALLLGIKDARAGYLHAYDSGPFSEEVWAALGAHRFDAAMVDSCIFLQDDYHTTEHMTAEQTLAAIARLRESGILKPEGIALATHFVHQAAGLHETLEAFYNPHGVQVAYDGQALSLGEDT